MRLVYTPKAAADFQQIWSYISKNNLEAADRLVSEIRDECRRLLKNPRLGHKRTDLTARPVRFWPVRRFYLIIYEVQKAQILVVRILHGSQDIASRF
jgi:addiction module RelE/StbE family toxin